MPRPKKTSKKAVDEVPLLESKLAQLPDEVTRFSELPLSEATQKGLKASDFRHPTPIQAKSIPLAFKGKDVLGAAQTGSGKTLAFILPLLENLFRKRWTAADGLGALVISPTRELAVQIFDVLRNVGRFHRLSAGLVIGGKSVKEEKERLRGMNILVCTPGRLLQHMDQTVGFEADNLQMLVLDEADRILDLGFASTLNAILENLPDTRQSLLFSATQTKSIKDLARLSLHDPEYVQVLHNRPTAGPSTSTKAEDLQLETPEQLEQNYAIVPLETKLDRLWAFIKLHLYQKSIVFASSCKQVRFIYEAFRHMQPGVVLLHLHGKQKQGARLEVFQRFAEAKHAVLIATDIAARGLDFPAVDWVVQLDAPEDVDTYVHRVGRTARYTAQGKALLFLLPSEEEGFLKRLADKKLTLGKLKIKTTKQVETAPRIQSLAFKFPELKFLGQKAFISYVRSIYLQKDKSVFKFDELPLEAFALSLGLPGAPHIKFHRMPSKEEASSLKNAARSVEALKEAVSSSSDEEGEGEDEKDLNVFGRKATNQEPIDAAQAPKLSKKDKVFKRQNPTVLAEHYTNLVERDESDEDDFMTIKRADHELEEGALPLSAEVSKRALRAGASKKAAAAKRGHGEKITFDDQGQEQHPYKFQSEADFAAQGSAAAQNAAFVETELGKMQEVDVVDKERVKERKREKKRKRKEQEREARKGREAVLAAQDESDGYVSPVFDLPSESEGEGGLEGAVLAALQKRKRQKVT